MDYCGTLTSRLTVLHPTLTSRLTVLHASLSIKNQLLNLLTTIMLKIIRSLSSLSSIQKKISDRVKFVENPDILNFEFCYDQLF